ncbi:hypothetical protein [Alicyclobacillus acidoterrestris]|uniref:Uncharacterized protein n=1 Tax=Alicyclobacillus acidoterrestris (strain ATCC 49025 / DSM 3922 / CIP 106132 / NCIMB 13137 / GD3B) TaxID=1356854 RepID=T0D8B9_ALIAG|nr:hypothetical protein [Alicyclobacillus acidoterrestris]EPZ47752.1 hypothetical protein N007_05720 [Alicyclobacillus acidoterrestris ATCC 49025]UNO47943.1 hypothetical protein K1I37_14810 [Alicyclobacillus acidoterrestris]
MRGVTPDWTEEEIRDLAMTAINVLANGGNISDGLREFVAHSEYRNLGSARLKWQTHIKNQYADAIEHAQRAGRGKKYIPSDEAREQFPEVYGEKESVASKQSTLLLDDDDIEKPIKDNVVKKSDVIKHIKSYLESVTIQDDEDYEEIIAQLRHENAMAAKRIAQLKKENEQVHLWKRKYEEVKEEYDVLLQAMNVARRHAANIDDVPTNVRVVTNNRGEVERVER